VFGEGLQTEPRATTGRSETSEVFRSNLACRVTP